MARKLRLQYPGAIYHVMNRGDRREDVFADEQDYQLFVDTLDEACGKTDWQVHAWCLMTNHFHLVLETPRANLVDGMHWLLGVFTNRCNHRHKEFGHLFSGRYKALVVDGSGNGYLKTVCDYVHLNPVRAGLIPAEEPLSAYPWSSYRSYLGEPAYRPRWLRVDRLLGEWGIPKDSAAGRQHFAQAMEVRRQADVESELNLIRQSWCLGSEQFERELMEQVNASASPAHRGEEIRQSALAKAQKIVFEELLALGWSDLHLQARPKGDPEKIRIDARLRRETTMTLAWIADQLHMGSPSHVSCLLWTCAEYSGNRDSHLKNAGNKLF
jgi:REP element-mobilizing transposase RayT